ncbi:AAA family ATPase [Leptolyngbya sp. 'hensonii']|uniref:AAA family ATPase n=1 Tax=Leptolyngbya sp. 'hensonii' TaxID=1922337 RepID=UPI000AE2E6B7|nr:AAA family ATPase [Leptolyngbya sp. 'hensonii']
MFLKTEQIRESLEHLRTLHPFYGITFLVCKKAPLPIGSTIQYPINSKETEFLEEYFKPDQSSQHFYQVFKTSNPSKRWLSPRYASTSSQSTRTRNDVAKAFIHPKRTDRWGWQSNYVEILREHLTQERIDLVPTFHVAVWLYRERNWEAGATAQDIVATFLEEFSISHEEENLFDSSVPESNVLEELFQDDRISLRDLQSIIGKAPDSTPEEGGTLRLLEIQGVGPAKNIVFQPGERLTLITGDNGLGKTFLLDCAWWALTGKWAGLQAYPMTNTRRNEPTIGFQISGDSDSEKIKVSYDWQTQSWKPPKKRPTIPGLLVYAKVDGSFAIWDPAKEYLATQELGESDLTPRPFVFTRDEVWDGRDIEIGGRKTTFINGLLQDWIQWQSRPESSPFDTLEKVLERLSPPSQSDLGFLRPGEPVRIPYDVRSMPTIEHSYGRVPIVYTSAGVRRIITLAYLIVWAWEEHKIQSKLIHKKPQKRMVILIDELEAHLHPQWQRVILSALLDVREDLASDLQVQLMVATHSPMIMASVESRFDEKLDKLFLLDLAKSDLLTNEIELLQLPFIRQGRIDAWLTSDVFGLGQPRSIEGEQAIQAAKKLQEEDNPNSEDVQNISDELRKYLAEDDEFWSRWLFFARQHGASL